MDLRTDLAFAELLAGSYRRLTGRPLLPADLPAHAAARWLYEEAPFGLLAHNTAADPVFVYGNRRAQALFEYDWHELTALPSRLSAAAPQRDERERFLQRVRRDGYVDDYRGERITKHQRHFWIAGATVWQLRDADGALHGQAAMIPAVEPGGCSR
ncbi:MEKHLA domain-containing protein [Bordetella genomosp. 2]|uniref:MEKHLA domain-containing protein n=1 Tax=Bordetella genomosp. 2 TaxID=1983456 RepID=A0A261VY82_9BORD|nr:MEKHLA domain-containing protein [Bordetella genomosp. 2]OZI79054.1 MEKHLA domain-containing protein [Bordetella genomosp. 2]